MLFSVKLIMKITIQQGILEVDKSAFVQGIKFHYESGYYFK